MKSNQSLDRIVKVKGYKDGLLFIIQPKPTLSEVEEALIQRLSSLGNSISGMGITLDIGNRNLKSEHLHNLQQWFRQKYGVEIKRIIMDYPNISQPVKNPWQVLTEPIFPKEEVTEPESKDLEEKTLVIRHTLRSGQQEEFLDGNIIVIGDVNPGAEVIASKDVIVLGALRGIAHAGASGDTSAVIIALNLIPTQLRIGNIVSCPPIAEGKKQQVGMEIARVTDGSIVVKAYKEY